MCLSGCEVLTRRAPCVAAVMQPQAGWPRPPVSDGAACSELQVLKRTLPFPLRHNLSEQLEPRSNKRYCTEMLSLCVLIHSERSHLTKQLSRGFLK